MVDFNSNISALSFHTFRTPSDTTAAEISELLSYSAFDWRVSPNEQQQAVELLKNSEDLNQVITQLDGQGDLDMLVERIQTPASRFELMRLLGGSLDSTNTSLVMPYIQAAGIEAEIQFNLGNLGLPIESTEFNPASYAHLISDDSSAAFTGVGATGVNPQSQSVGLIDSARLALGSDAAEAKYGNPLGNLVTYYDGLSATQRTEQVQLLVNQPISSQPTSVIGTQAGPVFIPGIEDSYASNIPPREAVIRLAADHYHIEPELLTAVILSEQRDQSAFEDAKDLVAATSPLEGNTSIGLGQVVVTTAQNNDLFAALLSVDTRENLSHGQTAELLASDEINIFATAKYIRQVADQGADFYSPANQARAQTTFPGIDLQAYSGHSSTWPDGNVKALASEYTSTPWDSSYFTNWGDFVFKAYTDTQMSDVFK